MIKRSLLVLLFVFAFALQSKAYGPQGHRMVGAIADQKIKSNPTVAAKIATMLDGITLAEAALIPDEIKSWDSHPPTAGHTFLKNHRGIEKQMIAFLKANPKSSPTSNHHEFHYTDVPVVGGELYSGGSAGRSDVDIVHMIPYCIGVLTGDIPETNPHKITKPVAVILLSHYLGDIHQPLHVGAEYFDSHGHPVNPDSTTGALSDTGGNDIVLVLTGSSGGGHGHGAQNPALHSFWDDDAVSLAMEATRASLQSGASHSGSITDEDLAKHFAADDPGGLDNDATTDPKKLSEAWADEILPIASDAHDRLDFSTLTVNGPSAMAMALAAARGPKWIATEKSPGTYADFAAATVENEIHKAGWRLAALLERTVN